MDWIGCGEKKKHAKVVRPKRRRVIVRRDDPLLSRVEWPAVRRFQGNCTYVGDGTSGVLIDCGPSTKQILKRMDAIGLGDAPIDAVLVTHEHADHAGSCRVLWRLEKERGKPVPFHMTPGTAAALKDAMVPAHLSTIDAGRAFRVGHLVVDPFRIPHDTSDPVAFRVGVGERWVGVITDLGKPTTLVSQKLASLSVAVLEFNHDVEMLLDGPYAWPVKQRIRSSHGHLSNAQAGQLLEESIGPTSSIWCSRTFPVKTTRRSAR